LPAFLNMSTPISDNELKEILERCNHATPGPWVSCIEGRDHVAGPDFIMTGTADERATDIELSGATRADQDFIAHASQDVPRLA